LAQRIVVNQEPQPSAEPTAPLEAETISPGYLVDAPAPMGGGDAVDVGGNTTEVEPEEHFVWQASEYIHHAKTTRWYGIVIVIAVLLAAGLAIFRQWFSIPVVLAMAVAIIVYGARPPRTLDYGLDEQGITIQGKSYPYSQFRSFAVYQDVAWHSIDLEPTQRFMPRLTVLFDNKDFAIIVSILTDHLPEIDRAPDWIERLSRYLKF